MSSFSDFQSKLDDLNKRARLFTSDKRHRTDLYQVIADCMTICEEAERRGFTKRIRELVEARSSGGKKGRVYFEATADKVDIIGRYIFEPTSGRANSWRYIASIKEAYKRQLSSDDIAQWLTDNGGLSALFFERKVTRDTVSTRLLRLNSTIILPKRGTFTLKLKRTYNGYFDVVSNSREFK